MSTDTTTSQIVTAKVSAAKKHNRPRQFVPFFHFDTIAPPQQLYGSIAGRSPLFAAFAAGTASKTTALFYWDQKKGQLVAPTNVQPDPSVQKGGKYKLTSDIYSFHPSKAEMADTLSNSTNNVQLSFSAQAKDDFGDPYRWITKAAINIATQQFTGSDQQTLNLSDSNGDSNNLTHFSSSEAVEVVDGKVSLWIGLAAHKKQGFWDQFLSVLGLLENSPIFGLLPLPKLAQSTVLAVTNLLIQAEKDSSLIPILAGNRADFRIWNGGTQSTDPIMALAPGFWVVCDYGEILPYIDYNDSQNLKKGIYLDIPQLQYDLKDANAANVSIDCTYAVISVGLDSKS